MPALLDGFVDADPDVATRTTGPRMWPATRRARCCSSSALVRIGLGGDLAAGLVVIVVAATTAPAVLATVRALGAEAAARRAAPFLVLGPAAVFMAVSADAVFGAVAAWGLAALAMAATRRSRGAPDRVVGGGRPAARLLRDAVLRAGRCSACSPSRCWSWRGRGGRCRSSRSRPRAWCWPSRRTASPGGRRSRCVRDRYWDGIAADRPAAYWMWGNLAALLVSAPGRCSARGSAVARGRAATGATGRSCCWSRPRRRPCCVADLSRMSKAEVERIWLPFVPWLLLSTALLPESWRRWGLALQMATALLVEMLLYTTW